MSAEIQKKPLDYGAFLADLEAKRAALDQAIASIRSLMISGALSASGDSAPMLTGNILGSPYGGEIPIGAFLGMSIPEAAKLCLQIVKRKMTTHEIADGLKKGGIETKGKTGFNAIVHSVLTRVAKSDGSIVKLDRSHWGLAEWYPTGLRTTQGKGENRRLRRAKPKRQKTANITVPATTQSAKSEGTDNGHHSSKLWQRAVDFIKSHPNEEFTAKQLSEQFGIHNKIISMTLAKPVKQGLIRMSAPSTYTSAQSER